MTVLLLSFTSHDLRRRAAAMEADQGLYAQCMQQWKASRKRCSRQKHLDQRWATDEMFCHVDD